MEHSKHIIRAVLLLVVIAVVFVLVTHFLIPETYGMHGSYRFANVQEFASLPASHGAPGACAECHEEEADALAGGKHASVSCEVCHAPLAEHLGIPAAPASPAGGEAAGATPAGEGEPAGDPGSGDVAGEDTPLMPINRSANLCGWCHEYLVSRPKTFPQVVLGAHVVEQGEELGKNGEIRDGLCWECHAEDVHDTD